MIMNLLANPAIYIYAGANLIPQPNLSEVRWWWGWCLRVPTFSLSEAERRANHDCSPSRTAHMCRISDTAHVPWFYPHIHSMPHSVSDTMLMPVLSTRFSLLPHLRVSDTAHVPTPIRSAGSIVSPTQHIFPSSLLHTYCTAIWSDPASSACRRYADGEKPREASIVVNAGFSLVRGLTR